MTTSQKINAMIETAQDRFAAIEGAAETLRVPNNVRHAKEARDFSVRFLEKMRKCRSTAAALETSGVVATPQYEQLERDAETCAGMIGAYEYGVNFLLTME